MTEIDTQPRPWVFDGALVRQAREEAGLSRAQVAAAAGWANSNIVRRIEIPLDRRSGSVHFSTPTVARLGLLAAVLGKNPGFFFRLEPK